MSDASETMSDAWAHDLMHQIMQSANQQAGDTEFHEIGHLIEYDPISGMCRCLLPSKRADDGTGNSVMMETGWCQLGTSVAGNGWGIQYHPIGGATQQNPEFGEQVQVSIQNTNSGLRAIANLTFNQTMPPPGSGQLNGEGTAGWTGDPYGYNRIQPGEWLFKQQSGTFVKMYATGDMQAYAARDLHAYVQRNLDAVVNEGAASVTVEVGAVAIQAVAGNVAVSAGGNIALTALGAINMTATGIVNITGAVVNLISSTINIGKGILEALCNVSFLENFNGHTHSLSGSPPLQQAVVGTHTTVDLEAS